MDAVTVAEWARAAAARDAVAAGDAWSVSWNWPACKTRADRTLSSYDAVALARDLQSNGAEHVTLRDPKGREWHGADVLKVRY